MAEADTFDKELRDEHIAESRRRLPGPSYYHVLGWIHTELQPRNYLEIGIRKGMSLSAAADDTVCIGVDPEPMVERPPPNTSIYPQTSDDFFARDDLSDVLGNEVNMAFIDGLHLFEQVIEDFKNVEAHSGPNTIALFHDTLPLDEITAGRERVTDFYSGDVWKAVLAIRRLRPDLEMATVPAAPTGLTLVRGLDPQNGLISKRIGDMVAEYMDLPFDYLAEHRDEMPPEIPNSEDAVRGWLSGKPAVTYS